MSVYLDHARNPYGRMVMCHMIADTLVELHAFAIKIGLKREWFQEPPKASRPHYDVSLSRRIVAVRYGAIELERNAFVEKMKEVTYRPPRCQSAP